MSLINGISCIFSGQLADRFGYRLVLAWTLAASGIMLFALAMVSGSVAFVLVLGVSAMYGAFIAVFPAFVNSLFGVNRGASAYGYIFTAWGVAGLLAPPSAAWLMVYFNSYQYALWVAAGLSMCSLLLLLTLKNNK